MRFNPAHLDEIRARLPLSTVVGRKVKLAKKGREWSGLSPFNKEKTPSFYVNDQKGFYHCFSSGKHGDQFSFLMETEGLSFPEAVERLAQEAGVNLPAQSPQAQEQNQERENLFAITADSQRFFRECLYTKEASHARATLEKRGIPDTIIETFGIGFAPDHRYALREHLTARSHSLEGQILSGMLIKHEENPNAYARFRDRLMFPIEDMQGRVIAFGGRALSDTAQAKYLNSPESPLFHKGSVAFNLKRARTKAHTAGNLYIVEGYFDVVAMHRAGFENTVAPMGTALTEEQLQLLWRITPELVLCFDGDKAGLRAAHRAIDIALPFISPERRLYFCILPQGQDPDDLYRTSGAIGVKQTIENRLSLIEMLWQRETDGTALTTPEQRASLQKRLRQISSQIKEADLRKFYEDDLNERLKKLFAPAQQSNDYNKRTPFQKNFNNTKQALPLKLSLSTQKSIQSQIRPREAMLLLAVLYYPALLETYLERFALLPLSHQDLESFRRFLVDTISTTPDTSATDLTQLMQTQEHAHTLLLLKKACPLAEKWLTQPSNILQPDYISRFKDALDLHEHAHNLKAELKAAETALSQDLSEANMMRLTHIKTRLTEIENAHAQEDL